MMMNQTPITREQWLEAAVEVVAQANPGVQFPPVKVSCSWPGGGSAQKRIGECWARKASQAGINEIFVSPKIEDASRVVSILVHELAHAIDDCVHGHRKQYAAIGASLGLTGKPTQMELPVAVADALAAVVIAKVGAFPHRRLDMSSRKKDKTYMLKCECGSCGAIFRMTAKVVAMAEDGLTCPVCREEDITVT
jgi:hypothetical protein